MKEDNFYFSTTAGIEAKLERDILAHEDKVITIGLVVALILMYLFRGVIFYWLKFGIAIPQGYEIRPIPVMEEPIQTDYTDEEKERKIFTYTSLINSHQITMMPQAHYVLSGKAVAINHDFWFITEFFDSAALYDLGTAWGKIADKKMFKKYIRTYSQKVEMTGARRLNWRWRSDVPYSGNYIASHISHSHIIPANRNIMAGLLTIKLWDNVQIEGELVDMEYYSQKRNYRYEYYTSLSRTDSDADSRGSGACEAVYVTKLRVGNRIYQ